MFFTLQSKLDYETLYSVFGNDIKENNNMYSYIIIYI